MLPLLHDETTTQAARWQTAFTAATPFRCACRSTAPWQRLQLRGYVPEHFPPERTATLTIGAHTTTHTIGRGAFAWEIPRPPATEQEITLELRTTLCHNPKRAGESDDDRDLAFQLLRIACE